MTKEEKIERLRKGIASETTPDHIRELMKEELAELEKPEPPMPVKKAPGNPNLKKGSKNPYYINHKEKKAKKAEEEARLKAEEEAKRRREFTADEKAALREEYAKRRAKKKSKIEEE